MKRSTQAKHAFIKLVLQNADRILQKKPRLNPATAMGIAFQSQANVILRGVAASVKAQAEASQ